MDSNTTPTVVTAPDGTAPNNTVQPVTLPVNTPEPGKSKTMLIVAGIVVVLVVAGIIAGIYFAITRTVKIETDNYIDQIGATPVITSDNTKTEVMITNTIVTATPEPTTAMALLASPLNIDSTSLGIKFRVGAAGWQIDKSAENYSQEKCIIMIKGIFSAGICRDPLITGGGWGYIWDGLVAVDDTQTQSEKVTIAGTAFYLISNYHTYSQFKSYAPGLLSDLETSAGADFSKSKSIYGGTVAWMSSTAYNTDGSGYSSYGFKPNVNGVIRNYSFSLNADGLINKDSQNLTAVKTEFLQTLQTIELK